MVEDFDIGPLTWVKDEIDQALKTVQENLDKVIASPDDLAPLRFSQAHLYQVSGALDMVGLEGCKRFCTEIETLTSKLEKQTIAVTPEVIATLTQAITALSHYLQDLLNGEPDRPLKLFPQLQAMMQTQGDEAEESELFFPDTSLRAPKDIPSKQISEIELPGYYAEQRSLFQKSLVSWLKNQSAEGAEGMRIALENVQEVQLQASQKTLWWATSAFADTLQQDKIAKNSNAKRLCRRVDQQLRALGQGNQRATDNLLRGALYYVAVGDPVTERIAKVKAVFELDHLLASEDEVGASSTHLTDRELDIAKQLLDSMEMLKDKWSAVSEGEAGALKEFKLKIGELLVPAQSLSNLVYSRIVAAMHAFVSMVYAEAGKVSGDAEIEVAAGLTLLEDAFRDYSHVNAEFVQRLGMQAQRIQNLTGNATEITDELTLANGISQDVLQSVAQQIKDTLKVAEQALDTFFRNPSEREVLHSVDQPLRQVAAAFDMLSMPVPTEIAKSSESLVLHMRDVSTAPDQSLFELIAESLSMLGLFVDEMPRIRSESLKALDVTLSQMQEKLQELGLTEAASLASALGAEVGETEPAVFEAGEKTAAATVEADKKLTDSAHDDELLEIYLTEAEEVLANIAQNLQALRVNATNNQAVTEVRRGFHTLKGSGRAVGLTNLGEVAWAVEKLLNFIMERKHMPSAPLLGFVEQASAAFAGWVAELRTSAQVEVNPEPWQQQAAALEHDFAAQKPKAIVEEVVISGTHKISRALFDIFMAEASQHMQVLTQALAELSTEVPSRPTEASRRAAHTLASNGGTAGFKAILNLARALEHWLDAHQGVWTQQGLTLYDNVLATLRAMLLKAGQLRQPRQVSGLLAALKEATIQAGSVEGSTQSVNEAIDDNAIVASADVPEAMLASPEPVLEETAEETVAHAEVEEAEAEDVVQPVPLAEELVVPSTAAVDDELLTMFVAEAHELVPTVGRELRAWRISPQKPDHSDELQRALHTLKGSARMAGQSALADSVHEMEDRVIRSLKNKAKNIDFDGLFLDLDQISGLLDESDSLVGLSDKPHLTRSKRSAGRTQYLRMRAEVLDRLINEAGEISIARSRMDREMQGFKQFSLDLTESVFRLRNQLREMEIEAESQLQSRMADLEESHEVFDPLEFDRFTRLQELTRMMAESVNDVATIQHGLLMNLDETESALSQQNRMNRELQHGLMKVRMVPFSMILERLQRIVRQTASELDKRVEMIVEGEAVDVDRSVLDKIGAPLEHLLRNAVAHGMETPAVRKKAKKPETGKITLKVRRESDEIVITVTDDGAGISLDKVRQKAIKNGLFAKDREISEQALMQVIFEPGFSTATTVTQISGRGVGLDSVRSDVTALGGRIDVTNSVGHGAVFSIYLPVTLSVAQVVLVRVGTRIFALPSVMVGQVQKMKPSALAEAYAAQAITWAGRQYSVHFLGKLIGDVEHMAEPQLYTPVILLHSGTYQIALHVDEIIGNQEVVMKPIGPQMARVPGMLGATVLGDGKIVLILNAVQLANREDMAVGAVKVSNMPELLPSVATETMPTVMVVDDSLTMRKVLGRVLEREGYRVVIAKDGMDALQVLQEITPDIILTDIEMPRMDGFELVRNIRGDAHMADIPLVIISSRTAEKHRNLARELGVNLFMGKPVQDDELLKQISILLGRTDATSETPNQA